MESTGLTEKWLPPKRDPSRRLRKAAYAAIVVCQHALVLGSLGVLGITVYLLCIGATTTELLPSSVLLLVSGTTSLVYLLLHNTITLLSRRAESKTRDRALTRLQWLSKMSLRVLATLWVATCGLHIVFTLARHPACLPGDDSTSINVGTTCKAQRSSVGAGLLSLLASGLLFVLVHKTKEPFRCHLFGVVQRPQLLPTLSPYKTLDRSYVSDLSFKCRSSGSMSSRTLVSSHANDSVAYLLPHHPEKAVGLGIYTPKLSQLTSPCFLTARPSLSSIRNHTVRHSAPRPPGSPLPPLPAYFPARCRYRDTAPGALHRAIYPPKSRPHRPGRQHSKDSIRVVPPSPAISIANLASFNKSVESLSGSSIYSCSVSGEKHSVQRPAFLLPAGRSISDESTTTLRRSPLGTMTRAEGMASVVLDGEKTPRASLEDMEREIDDAGALQARLEGDKVRSWHVRDHGVVNFYEKAGLGARESRDKRLEWTPLPVAKMRASVAFHPVGRQINSVA